MRNSWRFNFAVENNSSSPQEEVSTAAIGFTVARTEKGTVEPYYFPVGSEQEIKIMFGAAGIDYPDLEEAIYFNNSHPVYISGPAGGTSKVPSYYGGIYVSKYGIFNFYKVEDKTAPNYLANVTTDELGTTFNSGNVATKSAKVVASQECDNFVIENISKTVFDLMTKVTLKKGDNIYEYYLDKDKGYLRYLDDDGAVFSEAIAGTIVQDEKTKLYTITVGGPEAVKYGSYPAKVIECFDMPNLDGVSNSEEAFTSFLELVNDEQADVNGRANATITISKIWSESTTKVIPYYTKADGNINTRKYSVSVTNPFALGIIIDLTGSVHEYICQKSQTSKKTALFISNIGYDRWNYDDRLGYIEVPASRLDTPLGRVLINEEDKFVSSDWSADKVDEAKSAWDEAVAHDKNFWNIPADTPVIVYFRNEEDDDKSTFYVYTRQTTEYIDENSGEYLEKLVWTDVTADYTNLVLQISGPAENTFADPLDRYGIINNLYKSNGEVLKLMDPDSEDSNLIPEEYSNYDTLSFTQTEEVDGSNLSVGSVFMGSCDSDNTDVYGSSRYWPDVLPNDSVSYVEVYPVSSFSTLSDNGFYTGIKGEKGTYILQGQRYVSKVVEKLRKEGSNGSDVTSKTAKNFIAPLKEGWATAKSSLYSEVKVFFESSGFAALRTNVTSLRAVHQFATMVSNRRLTTSEFNNIKTLQVDIRKRGCPLYVGEFLVKDSLSGETYYSTLIGSVASLLADDMDSYLGGEAPMWVKVDSLGGQIDRSVISARWDFSQEDEASDTYYLDKLGVNPLVLTTDYGVMAVSQKTTELNAGDWSSLQHQMAFDLFQRELRDNVMVKLVGKNINDYWISKAKDWSKPIADKRTSGTKAIWFNAEVYVGSVNNATTRANKEFVIKTVVKVIPSAEKVTLILRNEAQGVTITAE